jgi:hypothetical protein
MTPMMATKTAVSVDIRGIDRGPSVHSGGSYTGAVVTVGTGTTTAMGAMGAVVATNAAEVSPGTVGASELDADVVHPASAS